MIGPRRAGNQIISFLLPWLLVTSCAASGAQKDDSQRAQTMTVFAAASLADAFTEIGEGFMTSHPNAEIRFNFGSSQTLRAQVEQGATADVFASASQKEMRALVDDGFVEPDAPAIFLTNRLAIIVPERNPAGIRTAQDLAGARIKLVLAAEEVPVGTYARQAIENLGRLYGPEFFGSVMSNVVSYEDSVKRVVTKVELGEADAGVVYVSDAVAAPALGRIEIPLQANVVAEYPIAVLRNAAHAQPASDFIELVLSKDGQAILKKWGFTPIHP
jgi:molybdate transport system substrate-binding protein